MAVKYLSLHQAHPVLLFLMTIFGFVAIDRCPKTRRWKRSVWRCCLVIACIIINISICIHFSKKFLTGKYTDTCILSSLVSKITFLVLTAEALLRQQQLAINYLDHLGDVFRKYPRIASSSSIFNLHLFVALGYAIVNSSYILKHRHPLGEIYIWQLGSFMPIIIDYFILCLISPLTKLSKSTLGKLEKCIESSSKSGAVSSQMFPTHEFPLHNRRRPEAQLHSLLLKVQRIQRLTELISQVGKCLVSGKILSIFFNNNKVLPVDVRHTQSSLYTP